jgi:ubiquinone/menaquinone biosynthesis C-methylase UbiE
MKSLINQKQLAIQVHSQQAHEFAASYRTLRQDAYSSCFTYSRHRLDLWLDRYLPERGDGLRLLDVGCGTGHHLARLRQRGFVVAGVDGSSEMLTCARLNDPDADLHCADVDDLPFPNESFDIVLCIEVLRYLPRPACCIREMARVLKPGGTCLVTAAPLLNLNGYWPINRLVTVLPIGGLVRLKQFFTTTWRLRREFVVAGLTAPSIHGVYFGPINWVERLAPGILSRFLQAWEPIDKAVADHPLARNFSNMFLIRAGRSH